MSVLFTPHAAYGLFGLGQPNKNAERAYKIHRLLDKAARITIIASVVVFVASVIFAVLVLLPFAGHTFIPVRFPIYLPLCIVGGSIALFIGFWGINKWAIASDKRLGLKPEAYDEQLAAERKVKNPIRDTSNGSEVEEEQDNSATNESDSSEED